MLNIRHFSRYTPDNLFLGAGVVYLISEDGHDWFECQKSFSDETVKVLYNDDGLITAVSRVAGHLHPEGYSVAELESLPAGCDILASPGRWKYDNGEIVDTRTLEEAVSLKTAEINAWRDEQEQGSVIFEVEGYNWDASLASLTRIGPVMTLVSTGVLPDGFFWTDADNEDIPATAELLTAIYEGMRQALVVQGFKIHERQRQMKQEVAGLATVAEIEAYEVGWGEAEVTEK